MVSSNVRDETPRQDGYAGGAMHDCLVGLEKELCQFGLAGRDLEIL